MDEYKLKTWYKYYKHDYSKGEEKPFETGLTIKAESLEDLFKQAGVCVARQEASLGQSRISKVELLLLV